MERYWVLRGVCYGNRFWGDNITGAAKKKVLGREKLGTGVGVQHATVQASGGRWNKVPGFERWLGGGR